MLALDKSKRIRDLNDAFRSTFLGGVVMITGGVQQLDETTRRELLKSVREFTTFTSGNDPYNEHDFGALAVGGTKFFWKIDYYDRAMMGGSEDPADSNKTTRVLTVMQASEY